MATRSCRRRQAPGTDGKQVRVGDRAVGICCGNMAESPRLDSQDLQVREAELQLGTQDSTSWFSAVLFV